MYSIEIANEYHISKTRPLACVRNIHHNFEIKDYVTDEKFRYKLKIKLYRSVNTFALKRGEKVICKRCVRCLKFK